MKKKLKFILVSTWIMTTRTYDAYATYQYTPDLSHEANPLVSILGFDWPILLLSIGLLSVLSIYAYFKATFHPIHLFPKEKAYKFSEFVGFTYTGEKNSWTALFFKTPKTLERFIHFMGILLTKSLVFAGFVSTIMWLLLNYTSFYKKIHSAPLIYSILIVGSSLIMYFWFRQKYLAYELQQ